MGKITVLFKHTVISKHYIQKKKTEWFGIKTYIICHFKGYRYSMTVYLGNDRKNHIQLLLPKLGSACYLARKMYPCCGINTLKMIYFAYFHSIMEYGTVFWGNSVESIKVFQQQKRIIRIMTGSSPRTSCRGLFKELEILTTTSQYVLSVMKLLSTNLENYNFNITMHDKNTRSKLKLHKPSTRHSMYQKNVYFNSIEVYNRLPGAIAELIGNKKPFSNQLKKYLINGTFYTMEEFLST